MGLDTGMVGGLFSFVEQFRAVFFGVGDVTKLVWPFSAVFLLSPFRPFGNFILGSGNMESSNSDRDRLANSCLSSGRLT